MGTIFSNSLGLTGTAALIALAGAAIWLWLWLTRPKQNIETDGAERLRRHLAVLAWLMAFVFFVFLAAGVLVQYDAAWFQSINPNENRLPPTFFTIFYVCYPAYVALGGAIYLYLKTRLPGMLAAVRWSLFIAVVAPFTFLPYYDAAIFDQQLTLTESLYLAAYWLIFFIWMVAGIAPLVQYSFKAIVGSMAGQGKSLF